MNAIEPKSKRGGKRPGAGRPVGAKDRASIEHRGTISELARLHTDVALAALVAIATSGTSETARVAAAEAILNRGYGRAAQAVELSGADGGPVKIESTQVFDALLARIEALARAKEE